MDVLHLRCCGLDVHKKSVVACVLTPQGKELRTFGTMTAELLALSDWLTAAGCTHVAMESTGVYWKPVYNLLEETGVRHSSHTRHGNPYICTALAEAARAAARTKGTYLGALYHRIAGRRGDKRAVVAVAHAILVSIYQMLKHGTLYQDLGPAHFDRLHQEAIVRRTVKRLENLAYRVSLQHSA